MKVLSIAILLGVLAVSKGNPFDLRVMGGYEIDIREAPYQVFYSKCGGVILTRRHIATAGHCLYVGQTIRAGSSNMNQGGQEIQIADRILHPEYYETHNIAVNDFALLILAEDLVFNEYVQPIPLARYPAPDGTLFQVSGWGLFQDGNVFPYYLQAVKVPQVNFETCKTMYGPYGSLMNENMFCAGFVGTIGACGGDSGGPIVFENKLYGLVSWGGDCQIPRLRPPGVYANIPNAYDWYMRFIQHYIE